MGTSHWWYVRVGLKLGTVHQCMGQGGVGRGGAAVSTVCAVRSPRSVLTVFFYHGGCWLVYVLNLQDGARIFPVHAIR